MKKILVIVLICIASTSAVVWEEDPSFTPEQRQQAKETNKRIREKSQQREIEMHKEIAQATQKFMDEVNTIKKKYPPLVG